MARPRYKPTPDARAQVLTMAGLGIPHEDIALILDIDAKTLRLYYRTELDKGMATANMRVAGNLFRIATGSGREAVQAAIFWMKTRAGWSEYAPAPSREPLGKKERAKIDSQQAAQGTRWGQLLN
jgi:hypothetical protein